MENYPSNSRKTKEEPEPKKVDKVISGEVVRRKKPLGKRLAETFVGGDAKSVWGYVAYEVLIPAAKDTISDAISQGIERMLFGEVRGGRRGSHRPGVASQTLSSAYTNYNRIGGRASYNRPEPRREMSRQARATHDFDEIVLESRGEAEEVLSQMYILLEKYEVVTVSDLYEMIGQTASFTDEKFGWTDLRGAAAIRVKHGYLLDLPRPEEID